MALPEEPEGGEENPEQPEDTPEGGDPMDSGPKKRRKRHNHGSRKRAVAAFCKYVNSYHSISLPRDLGVVMEWFVWQNQTFRKSGFNYSGTHIII